jgi:hypothetical protein
MNQFFIAHYKAVNTANEFYSKKRSSLDFPTQLQYKSERYTLHSTYVIAGNLQENNIKLRLSEIGVTSEVDIDKL